MRKLTLVFTLTLLILLGAKAQAQSYTTGIGLRIAPWYGFTIKHHLSDDTAIEGIIHTRWRGLLVTVLYEKHFPAFGQDGLRWYIGAGGHVGFWNDNRYRNNPWFYDHPNSHVGIGVDLIGGIEYTIPDVPINISLDIKPGFNIVPGFYTIYDDGALSVRFVF